MKRKICIVTGTRAEYGLFFRLLQEIKNDPDLQLQIVATGMHLSPEFGLTYKAIEKDGFKISKKVEMLLSSDTPVGITKSVGLGIIGFADAFEQLHPDIMVLLGDRFESFSVAIAAMLARIPIAHLHGGETSVGAFDEAFRHSITKMSQLHFVATEEYRRRVIQLGEDPEIVFNVGSLGIDNIENTTLMSKEEFETSINFKLGCKNLMITFHPVTLEPGASETQFQNLLEALDVLKDAKLIFTKPNADTEGRILIKMIDDYVRDNNHKAVAFVSLGKLRFLSAMQYIDGVVGNSSSGLIEAPTFKIGTINIGDRQKGRIKANSVIDCQPTKSSILKAFRKLYSEEFIRKLKDIQNPYGEGGAAKKIKKVLKEKNIADILKKQFYDIYAVDNLLKSKGQV